MKGIDNYFFLGIPNKIQRSTYVCERENCAGIQQGFIAEIRFRQSVEIRGEESKLRIRDAIEREEGFRTYSRVKHNTAHYNRSVESREYTWIALHSGSQLTLENSD